MKYFDKAGAIQEVNLTAEIYKDAALAGQTVPQYINTKFETDTAKYGSVFDQMCSAAGLFLQSNAAYGIKAPTMAQVMDGAVKIDAGVVVREASPVSRILFPAVFLEAIENKLKTDTGSYAAIFEKMIAISDTINGARFEQPVLNYANPEAHRSQVVSQLALPNAMMGITVSDTARKIPTFSLGMEISKEALQSTSIDFVALALARQAEFERTARIDEYISAFLLGDADMGSAALAQVKANTFDTAITANGTLTHKAWVSWLRKNYRKRHIDYVMCDLATALIIENRTGKPTVQTDDPNSPRINPTADVINPQWQNVKIFLLEDGVIPTNTIMGIDSRYAIRRVRNSQAEYSAVESFVLRKSEAMRYDFGEVAYRMFDEAFEVLLLNV